MTLRHTQQVDLLVEALEINAPLARGPGICDSELFYQQLRSDQVVTALKPSDADSAFHLILGKASCAKLHMQEYLSRQQKISKRIEAEAWSDSCSMQCSAFEKCILTSICTTTYAGWAH